MQELQQKAEETELLHREQQMLETERVRLSLVEEKLMDVLQLLQQLRDLVSLRSNSINSYLSQVCFSNHQTMAAPIVLSFIIYYCLLIYST